jgi:hypothetical protein
MSLSLSLSLSSLYLPSTIYENFLHHELPSLFLQHILKQFDSNLESKYETVF